MFSPCSDDFCGWVQRRNSVQGRGGLGRRCPSRADPGASREALQGKALEHRHWGQGWKSSGRSVPGRRGLTKCREPGEVGGQSMCHPFGLPPPISKERTVSHGRKGAGQVGARAQGAGSRPEQPSAGGARPAGSWTRCCGAGGGRLVISSRRQPIGGEGVWGAGRKPHLKLCDASRSRFQLSRRRVSQANL